MVPANQREFSRLKQRSVIKSFVAENYKPREIYRSMCYLYRETCFGQKIVTNWLNMGCAHRVMVIVKGNGHGDQCSNPGWSLIPEGKVWIQILSL